MKVRVSGVGLSGPGLPDWQRSAAVLRGETEYLPLPYQAREQSPLAGPERRRATAVTRLALAVAMEAAGQQREQWDLPTVFASSGGEVDTCDAIFRQLALPERAVSPTQFHNSVHNAASGYWGIASGSREAATNLACFDDTFAAGLLEAAALIAADRKEVLLVAYDHPPPHPIGPFRPLLAPFAVALRLGPEAGSGTFASLEIDFEDHGTASPTPTPMATEALEALRLGNPAARALPLLAAIAARRETIMYLARTGPGLLRLEVSPCL